MPMITVKYDDTKVGDQEIIDLANALQQIIIEATNIKDVFVYADSPKIKIAVAPIEVFVQMGAGVISDKDALLQDIKGKLANWKQENNFAQPVTLTLMPMDWKFEVGI